MRFVSDRPGHGWTCGRSRAF